MRNSRKVRKCDPNWHLGNCRNLARFQFVQFDTRAKVKGIKARKEKPATTYCSRSHARGVGGSDTYICNPMLVGRPLNPGYES